MHGLEWYARYSATHSNSSLAFSRSLSQSLSQISCFTQNETTERGPLARGSHFGGCKHGQVGSTIPVGCNDQGTIGADGGLGII